MTDKSKSKAIVPPFIQPPAYVKAYAMTMSGYGYRDVWEFSSDGTQISARRIIEQSTPQEAMLAVRKLTTSYEIHMLDGQ